MSVIYVLKHPHNPSVCKIGESSVGAQSRTSYQGINWIVYEEFPIAKKRRKGAENFIFKALESSNANVGGGAREIFTIPADKAARTVEKLLVEFIAKISANTKDSDYWNYVATDEEKRNHDEQLAEERARKEAEDSKKQRAEEFAKQNKDRKERHQFLVTRLATHKQDGWFSVLTFCVFAAGFFIPSMLVVAGSCALFDCDLKGSTDFYIVTFFLVGLVTIVFMHRDHESRTNDHTSELEEFESSNLVRCSSCGQRIWRPLDKRVKPRCPKCKSPLCLG